MLLLVGASVRALAESAVRAGYQVTGADLFADWDTQKCCRVHQLKKLHELSHILKTEDFVGVAYSGGIENHLDLITDCERHTRVFGCSAVTVGRIRNPMDLFGGLSKAGFRSPMVAFKKPPHGLGNWVIKPLKSVGGINVRIWDPDGSAPGAVAAGEFYFQQFIPGRSISFSYLSGAGKCVSLGAVMQQHRHTQSSSFGYAGCIGPIELSSPEKSVAEEIGQWLTTEYDLTGWFGVDYVINEQGLWPVEVNPRYTASMEIFERMGLTLFSAHMECQSAPALLQTAAPALIQTAAPALIQTAVPASWPKTLIGKQVVYNELGSPIVIDEQVFAWLCEMHGQSKITDVPRHQTVITPGHPICTVWTAGPGEVLVEQSLERLARLVLSRCAPVYPSP